MGNSLLFYPAAQGHADFVDEFAGVLIAFDGDEFEVSEQAGLVAEYLELAVDFFEFFAFVFSGEFDGDEVFEQVVESGGDAISKRDPMVFE